MMPAEFDAESSTVRCNAPSDAAHSSAEPACKNSKCEVYCSDTNELLLPNEEEDINAFEPYNAQGKSVFMALSFVDRFLALWIILAMILGVLLGYFCPSVKTAFESVSLDTVSLPVAIGLWGMVSKWISVRP